MKAKEKALNWLSANNLDAASKAEIEKLLKQEGELNESFLLDLEFGTGGLRGIMGIGTNRMNKYTVGMATQGFSNYLKREVADKPIKVAIAHDSRINSRLFAETTANIFSANGIEVFLFEELRPTPQLSFAIRHYECQGGVVITASHNPKEYNGYKAYWSDGGQIVPPHDRNIIQEVQQIKSIDEVNFESNPALIHSIGKSIDDAYIQMVESLTLDKEAISANSDLKIVFSSIHGTGITLVPTVLEKLGFTNVHVVEEQAQPDGNFPTVVYPNPEEKEAMTLALDQAKSMDADLVMATDPDADRVGIGVKNSKGEFQLLNGNQTGVLLVYYLLLKESEKGFNGNEYVGKTIVTTELIQDIADKYGVNCYNTLTGFKWIANLIKEKEGAERFIGGGEESYGYMIGEKVRDKDAVASCALIAEMTAWAKTQGLSPFELLCTIYETFGFYYEALKSVTKKGLKGKEEIDAMMEGFRNDPPKTLAGSPIVSFMDYQEGIKKSENGDVESLTHPKANVLQYLTADGSKISIRPSGTEPKIKFYFSVRSEFIENDYFLAQKATQQKIDNILSDLKL